jgi:type IV pilus assembly protein PilX
MNLTHGNPQKQKGIVLVVSLIFLLLMTIIGISGMKNTVLEEKMAGNFKDRNMAFQSAESALRAGELYLFNTTTLPLFDGTTAGLYQPSSSGLSRWNTVTWTDASQVRSYVDSLTGITDSPDYIIEELPVVSTPGGSLEAGTAQEYRFYRITGQAVGGTNSSTVLLQSTYKR